jgi:nucleoside-diphosphate-sugar epimerase
MRVVIIGGSGHIGTYLVPRLVEAGHEVINVSRGQRRAYQPHVAWESVQHVVAERAAEEKAGTFGQRIRDLKGDVVIDMISFTLDSTRHIVDALRGEIQQFLHCGTIWAHGPSVQVPTVEEQPRHPFGDYGIQKAAIEAYLLAEARRSSFPATVLMPGHIVGPGWAPLNPQGNFKTHVFAALSQGSELTLPNLGMETVHHVHADDVAQAFFQAMVNWRNAVGENFHVVSPAAVTLRGYAETVSGWFGHEAKLRFMSWDDWQKTVSPEDAQATWDHIAHSPNCSIAKAKRLIGYRPRYSSFQAVQESVNWLIEQEVMGAQ